MRAYPHIYDWSTANAFLARGRNPDQRWIGVGRRHTFVMRHANGVICIKQHATNIITYCVDGTATLHTGGWNTITTRERLNALTRARIWSEGGSLRMSCRDAFGRIGGEIAFQDGMRIVCETGEPIRPKKLTIQQRTIAHVVARLSGTPEPLLAIAR